MLSDGHKFISCKSTFFSKFSKSEHRLEQANLYMFSFEECQMTICENLSAIVTETISDVD